MENVGRMHCLQGSQGLVNEVLAMVIRKLLSSYDTMHIGLHQFLYTILEGCTIIAVSMAVKYLNEVHFRERVQAPGFLDVENRNDVLMVEVPQQFHLSEGSEAEH